MGLAERARLSAIFSKLYHVAYDISDEIDRHVRQVASDINLARRLLEPFQGVGAIRKAMDALERAMDALEFSIPDLLRKFTETVVEAEKEVGTF